MDTIEIKQYLGRIHPSLSNNVYAANRLPLYVKTPSYLISNLDPDSEPGSHWVAIHIDRCGFGQYFDSYGRPPSTYHKEFLRRNARHCAFNRKPLHKDWWGVRDELLSDKAGIKDCVFCHSTGFIGGNRTREGALEMAVASLEAES